MVLSIFIYLITFGISISFAYVISLSYKQKYADSSSKGRNILTRFILYFFIILPPCLLAAFRDYTVGVDLLNFANKTYPLVLNSNSFASFSNAINLELIYELLIYFSIKLTGGLSLFLFLIQLIVMVPITVVGYKMRNEMPIWAIISVYLFVFYNNSLNLMQQSMACSIILLSFTFWIKKSKLKAIMLFIIAILIHQSALIFLPIFILAQITSRDQKIQWRQFTIIVGIIYILVGPFESIITWIVFNTNLLPVSYMHYYNIFITQSVFLGYYIDPLSIYSMFDLIMRILFVVIPILILNNKMHHNRNIKMERNITLISIVFYSFTLFKFNTMYGSRISLYGDFFIILFLSRITTYRRNVFLKLIFWSMILLYWFVFVIRLGWSGTSYYIFRVW